MNIVYNVTLFRNVNELNKTREEAESVANRKREKWRDGILGYIFVTVGGQPNQLHQQNGGSNDGRSQTCSHVSNNNSTSDDQDVSMVEVLPLRPPETERQMEDYAHGCAAVQNILLSLHSEGLGAKVS